MCASSRMVVRLPYSLRNTNYRNGSPMLRVSSESDKNAHTIKLEGKIIGLWVDELHSVWRSVAPELQGRQLYLDVRGLSFVDARGKLLLREIYQATNASFLADSPLTKRFVQDAMQGFPETAKK
jgi:hypothetical protein